METKQYIPVALFCEHYQAEISFIMTLGELELIHITIIEGTHSLDIEDLVHIERYLRLHDELSINPEGIEAILYLQQKIDTQQKEIARLKSLLKIYEHTL
jgi:hypothetical protein